MSATATTTTSPYSFPSEWKASFQHWWSKPKTAAQEAEHGLVKRGLGPIDLISAEEAATRAATSSPSNEKVAVFRDVHLDPVAGKKPDPRRFLHSLEVGPVHRTEGERAVIVTHGYGNGLGFYFQNLQSIASQPNQRTFFLDWLGMGRSGRPTFPSIKTHDVSPSGITTRVQAAESFFVDSLEEFRIKSNISKMTLVGHSIGGYLSSAYALKHPERVEKLVLISPVGVPMSPYAPAKWKGKDGRESGGESASGAAMLEQDMFPSGDAREEKADLPPAPNTWWTYLWEKNFSPFGVLRASTFLGPSILSRYANRRFAAFPEEVQSDLFNYLYEISTDRGSGEYCLAHLLAPGAYARWPLLSRLDKLDIPITFIYGDSDWMDKQGGYDVIKKIKAKPTTPETTLQKLKSKVFINSYSGHWVFLENPKGFDKIIEKELADL